MGKRQSSQKVGGRIPRKNLLISLFFLLMLLFPTVQVRGSLAKWYYWLEPGAYVTYALISNRTSQIERWLAASPASMGEGNAIHFLCNATYFRFTNVSLTWTVLSTQDDKALVKYELNFLNLTEWLGLEFKRYSRDQLLLSMDVWVKLDSLEAYNDEGTYIGRWPFWIHGYETESNFTMVHDVLLSSMTDPTPTPSNITGKLVDFETAAELFDLDLNSIGVYTSVSFFSLKRSLTFLPAWRPMALGNSTVFARTPVFSGSLYDKVSLIMVAYQGLYVEDILLCMIRNMTYAIDLEASLVIVSSNIDFSSAEKDAVVGDEWKDLIPWAALMIVVGTAGGFLYAWKRKHR
jgi:hypothetical protein